MESDLQKLDLLIDQLDGSGSDAEWQAKKMLDEQLGVALPAHLLRHFRLARKWAARASYIYHSMPYAKSSEAALELALLGLRDKSTVVRYRACQLLAYSQRIETLKELKRYVDLVPGKSREDVLAAIDAIECQNQNYFLDREHSGLLTMNIV